MSHRILSLFALLIFISSCEDQYVYTPPAGVKTPTDIFGDMYREMLIMDTMGVSKQVANGFPKSDIRDIKLAFRKQSLRKILILEKCLPRFGLHYFTTHLISQSFLH